jgi:hypothetical protein
MRLAARVAVNRTVAGVHFPVDSVAGMLLGLTLGNYFVSRCAKRPSYKTWSFEGNKYPSKEDFDWTALYDVAAGQIAKPPYVLATGTVNIGAKESSPMLSWLWNKAVAEWP